MNNQTLQSTLRHWGQTQIIHPLIGGYRNQAWLIQLNGQPHVAKTTRRTETAMQWLEAVHDAAEEAGFLVPRLLPSNDGHLVVGSVTVEMYIQGQPASSIELQTLAATLTQFHQQTSHLPQRPTFASSTQLLDQDTGGDVDFTQMPPALVNTCRDAWHIFAQEPQSVVHGDLNPSNILLMPDGQPALIDWDEARVDASVFDQLLIADKAQRTPAQQRALTAWEIAACWHRRNTQSPKNLGRRNNHH